MFPGFFLLWIGGELSQVARNVLGMGNLASAVDELLTVDVRDAPGQQLRDETVEIYRQINRLNAALLQRVEAVDRRGLVPEEGLTTQACCGTRRECRRLPRIALSGSAGTSPTCCP